ncbi:MAG: hypothetical protein RG741_03125 [Bacteroidales bacterium]|nr:hypothetical protein [Bacteroidales bacterium]
MASRKNLKSDINYLIDEVVGTCLMHKSMNDKKDHKMFDELIEEALKLREDLIRKVNQPKPGEGDKNLRAYYRTVYSELLNKVNGYFEKLQKTSE